MGDLCRRAFEAHRGADRAFLNGLIAGSDELLSEDTFPYMEPMFARYPESSAIYKLLERAAEVFGEAMQEAAGRAMAAWVIGRARRRARI